MKVSKSALTLMPFLASQIMAVGVQGDVPRLRRPEWEVNPIHLLFLTLWNKYCSLCLL